MEYSYELLIPIMLLTKQMRSTQIISEKTYSFHVLFQIYSWHILILPENASIVSLTHKVTFFSTNTSDRE